MKSELLYTKNPIRDIRISLAYEAEFYFSVQHLSFSEVFKTPTLDKRCTGTEAYQRAQTKLTELGHRELYDSKKFLTSFRVDHGSGVGGRACRRIYSTNAENKLIIIDEAEDRDHAILTDQIISIISDISKEERSLIDTDVFKLNSS